MKKKNPFPFFLVFRFSPLCLSSAPYQSSSISVSAAQGQFDQGGNDSYRDDDNQILGGQ